MATDALSAFLSVESIRAENHFHCHRHFDLEIRFPSNGGGDCSDARSRSSPNRMPNEKRRGANDESENRTEEKKFTRLRSRSASVRNVQTAAAATAAHGSRCSAARDRYSLAKLKEIATCKVPDLSLQLQSFYRNISARSSSFIVARVARPQNIACLAQK